MMIGIRTVPAITASTTATSRLLDHAIATNTKKGIPAVHRSQVRTGAGVSSQPNQPIISRYQSKVEPTERSSESRVDKLPGAWAARDASCGLTIKSQTT